MALLVGTGGGWLARILLANYHLVILLTAVFLLKSASADILVYDDIQLLEEFRDFPATFGEDIPESGIKVRAVRGKPHDGCSKLDPPPETENGTSRFAVIIARYNCSFEEKVRNAQNAGYAVTIVHNVGSNDLEHMSANHAEDIITPSVFIGETNGLYIMENYLYPLSYTFIITDDVPFNINNNLIIPFAIVVGLCFIIMVCFMIIRCIRERRRQQRHRLPNSVLRKIPIVKFAKGMQYDTCAICLDDYVDNERLRVLPCHHAYHVKCIDPWLTKNRRVCPICKRKVFARGERRPPRRRSSTDSMSSTDADENSPLLNHTRDPEVVDMMRSLNSLAGATSPSQQQQSSQPAAAAPQRQPQDQRQRRQPNEAHVVNMTSDDEEMLDAQSQVQPGGGGVPWRFNPFDRVNQAAGPSSNLEAAAVGGSPYSPIGEDQASTSTWQRFMSKLRFYRRSEPTQDDISDEDDVDPVTTPEASSRIPVNSAATSSNNILNINLAGSFHGEETTDDELVGASIRADAKRRQIRSAPNLPSTSRGSAGAAAAGGAGRLGVAALPNVNFDPSQPFDGQPSSSSGRRSNRSGGENYPV
ncbi:E3 ubiquitin-protein ligase RNF13 isoform X2 [Uranotaenia lowii]|uniref:E3 ubiquitin-protein ligase RNF13 isoform X2 n=1 Tax=Uranotaenia lowii TaxID=190385 RepID=UPI00247AF6A1|nr:E3 ubiquitin-protein ligase RNF13 isoform X2 [Uranotaenia lowii]